MSLLDKQISHDFKWQMLYFTGKQMASNNYDPEFELIESNHIGN